MKNKNYLLLLILLIPAATALEITAPTQDITVQEIPTNVEISWEGNHTEYELTIENQEGIIHEENLTTTSTTKELAEGTYTIRIQAGNQTTNTTFEIQKEEQTLQLGLEAEKNEYQIGETIKITASASKPTTAKLDIKRNGEGKQNWTLSINEKTNVIYIPEQAGTYSATLNAQGTIAATSWEVKAPALEISISHEPATRNRPTKFNATATGGSEPYTYQWQFSDSTNNQGKEITHYFFEPGEHEVTLIVQDNNGRQASKSKTFTVSAQTHTLEIITTDENYNPLSGYNVTLNEQHKTTNQAGIAAFSGLAAGNYTLRIHDEQTTHINQTLEVTRDTSRQYTITQEPTNQTTTNQTTTNTTNTTTQQETIQEEEQETEAEREAREQQEQQEAFEEEKQRTLKQLEDKQFNFQLANQQDRVLKHLKLYERFSKAKQDIQRATNQEQLSQAQKNVPQQVRIQNEQNRIIHPEARELETLIETYLEAQNITEERIKEQYRYSIKQLAKNTSIQRDSYTALITYPDKQETHTIVEKTINAPSNSRYIEIIPTSFANNAEQIRTENDYTIIRENPILEFHENTYTYSAATNQREVGRVLVIPNELTTPPLFGGLAGINIGPSDAGRTLIYLVILGLFAAGIFAGKTINTRREQQMLFEEFYSLADQAVDLTNQGNTQLVAELTPHINDIHQTLPEEQQQLAQEIVEHLNHTTTKHEFLTVVTDTYETVKSSEGNINQISSAYEQALDAYEKLPAQLQGELAEHLHALEEQLDEHINT